jgi:ABC-type transporter Mla maintaining outer membrane lipid asymmetry permease subunit MlaE
MPELDQDRWETATAVVMATLKAKVADLVLDLDRVGRKVDETIGRIHDGILNRLLTVEHQVKTLENAHRAYKKAFATIAVSLFISFIVGMTTGYFAIHSKSAQLEQAMGRLERQMNMKPPQ